MKTNKMLKQAACLALALLLMSPMLISPVQATDEDDPPEGFIGRDGLIDIEKYLQIPIRDVVPNPWRGNDSHWIIWDAVANTPVEVVDLPSRVKQGIVFMEESDQDEEQGFWGTLGRGIKKVGTFAGSMVVGAVKTAGNVVVGLGEGVINLISNPFAAPVPPTQKRP
jgi:hypothetical protein